MSLTMDQMKDLVVEDLAGKIRELDEENKTLKMKNKELTDELHKQNLSNGHGVEGHEQGHQPRRKQMRYIGSSAVSELVILTVPTTNIANANNSLEMEKILGLVMAYVRPMDLPTCRQVSKLWKKAAQKDFQGRVTFHIDNNHLSLIEEFMEYARNGFAMFRNLKIDLARSGLGIKENLRQLFIAHGRTLHKLRLNICRQFPMNNWNMNDLRIFLCSLVEIQELEIHVSPTCPLQGNEIFRPHRITNVVQNLSVITLAFNCNDSASVGAKTQFFLDLLHLAPNLKTLIWGSNVECLDNQLMHCLIQVNPPNLENLFFQNWIASSAVESLANSQLNLKKLYLDDFNDFGVKFHQSGKSEVTPRQISYGHRPYRISGAYLKIDLEDILDQFSGGDVSCTRLLQIFTSALTEKLLCTW